MKVTKQQFSLYQDGWNDCFSTMNVQVKALQEELRRCVTLLDGECCKDDGSNADTCHAHVLLGDKVIPFLKDDE